MCVNGSKWRLLELDDPHCSVESNATSWNHHAFKEPRRMIEESTGHLSPLSLQSTPKPNMHRPSLAGGRLIASVRTVPSSKSESCGYPRTVQCKHHCFNEWCYCAKVSVAILTSFSDGIAVLRVEDGIFRYKTASFVYSSNRVVRCVSCESSLIISQTTGTR